MSTRKRSRSTTGRKRGRPRKAATAPPLNDRGEVIDPYLGESQEESARRNPHRPAPPAPPADVDAMIAAATAAAPADRTAALDALANELQEEAREQTTALSGEIHTPRGASDKAVAQLAQEIAALSVVAFGLVALWRGPEWALSEEEAELLGDATATPYADEAEALARKVKWFGPAMALAGIVGRKAVAETERRRNEHGTPPRAPGLSPANG